MAKKTPDQARIEKLRKLNPGDSFFVEGATSSSMQTLRRLAAEVNIPISVFSIANDVVHKKAGVRVFRNKS